MPKEMFRMRTMAWMLVILCSATSWLYAAPDRPLEDVSFVLNWLPNGSHAPFYMAQERGYYVAEGLKVQILPGSGSGNTVKVVGSGAQDFGLAGGESVAIGRAAGVPVVSIAALQQRSPICLLSLRKSKISTPTDLVGKTMGVKFGSSTYPAFKAILKKFKIDESKINEKSIGPGVQHLLIGDVDAMDGHLENEAAQLRAEGADINVLPLSALGFETYGVCLISSEATLKAKPTTTLHFLRASIRGIKEAMKDPETAVQAVQRLYPTLKKPMLVQQLRGFLELFNSPSVKRDGTGWQTLEGWKDTVKTWRDTGQIKQDFPVEALFTTKLLGLIPDRRVGDR